MIKGIYCIKDIKAKTYNDPIVSVNDDVAKRCIDDLLVRKDDYIYNFADDYSLWKIGTFNTETGEIKPELTCIEEIGVRKMELMSRGENDVREK
jgi:hypothetical protein